MDAGEALPLRLQSVGFTTVQVALRGDEEGSEEPRFKLYPGPFSPQRASTYALRKYVENRAAAAV